MTNPYRENALPLPQALPSFAVKVYTWMVGLLLLTAAASGVGALLHLPAWFAQHPYVFIGLLFSELVLVGCFTYLRKSMTLTKGLVLMGTYGVINGITLSAVLHQYKPLTVALTFGVTAAAFSAATVYGLVTRKSLDKAGPWLLSGMFGLLLAMLLNLVLRSNFMDYVISCIGVVIFIGLAMYDAQKIKGKGQDDPSALSALDASIEVYLDFLNLFLFLLRILGGGGSKSND